MKFLGSEDLSVTQSEKECQEGFAGLFSFLKEQKILVETAPDYKVVCQIGDKRCLIDASKINDISDDYFYQCECEETGLKAVEKNELRKYRLDVPAFAKWMRNELSLRGELENDTEGLKCFLGNWTKRSKIIGFYFVRFKNYQDVEKSIKSIIDDNLIVLFPGEKPKLGNTQSCILSLSDFLDVKQDQIVFRRSLLDKLLPKKIYAKPKDIILSQHIRLRKVSGEYRLIMNEKHGGFEEEVKITEGEFYITRFLYENRNSIQKSFRVEDLAERKILESVGGIRNAITNINKKTKEHLGIEIIKTYDNTEKGLNRDLDCCE